MAYTDIDKPDDYFNTVLYTGNATTNAITGVGFQPDLIWVKSRSAVSNSNLIDSVRGVKKHVSSSSTNAEDTEGGSNGLSSFDSDGFTWSGVNTGTGTVNASSTTYVGWSWLGGGTAVSNTDGSITSTVSANTTSGFSIVSWTGTGADGTVGHGLGTTPAMIITKARSAYGSDAWVVFHQKSWGNDGNGLALNNTASIYNRVSDLAGTGITAWSSSTFTINQGSATYLNNTSIPYIGYCWSEVKGYSKFGSYTGNGSADGTFIYTGFKPAFLLVKRTDTAGNWIIWDNKRNNDTPAGANYIDLLLYPNASDAEVDTGGAYFVDILSNGFKLRGTGADSNASGGTYIYMAFAENPFVTSTTNGSIPATAR